MDHSYARSLARFAATLGPVAWKVASKRIEQALPSGSKFGRGWVGEYEPLPTPVLMLENCSLKEPDFFKKIEKPVDTAKDKAPTIPVSSKENPLANPQVEKLPKIAVSASERIISESNLERRSPFTGPGVIKPTATPSSGFSVPSKEQPIRVPTLNGRSSFFSSPGTRATVPASPSSQQPNSQPRSFAEPEQKVLKQVELNCPPTGTQNAADFVAERQMLNSSEMPTSRSMEMVSKNRNLMPSGSFKHPNTNGVAGGGLPGGKISNLDNNRVPTSSADMAKAMPYLPHGQDQGLTDPVQLMRMFAEKAQNQQRLSNQSLVENNPVMPSSPSLRREDPTNAAAVAARAWMSIGAGGFRPPGENVTPQKSQISADSLYNSARDFQLQMSRFRGEAPPYGSPFQPEKSNFPLVPPFVPHPTRIGSDGQFPGQAMVFPQLVRADLSRFQVQSPWQSLSPQMQQRQKQESLPPDLNISFQSSGSPGRPASNVLVDSQQPDLALQL